MPKVKPWNKQYRRFEVDVSDMLPDADAGDLLILGEDIVDFIVHRTLSGKDVFNNTFVDYTDEYAEREGKSNPPDLVLTGNMLEDLEVLEIKPRAKRIVIGYEPGYEGLGKVKGNITGSYGRKPDKNKARNFLGITPDDLERVIEEF